MQDSARSPRQRHARSLPACCGARLDQPAGPARTPAPDCSRSRTRSSASLTRTVPPARSAPACRHRRPATSPTSGHSPAGLLDLAGSPAPEPVRGASRQPPTSTSSRSGNRTPNRQPGSPPSESRPRRPSATGRRRQRRPGAHRRPHPRRQHRRSPRAAKAPPPFKHQERRPDQLGPDGSPCRLSRAPMACKPPTTPSCEPSPTRSARREAGATQPPAAARWGPENIPALIPEDWYAPPLHADRRRQPRAHPPHGSAPAGPDDRRRITRRSRRTTSESQQATASRPAEGTDLLLRRHRPLRRQAADRPAPASRPRWEPRPRTQRTRHAPGQLPAAPPGPGELGIDEDTWAASSPGCRPPGTTQQPDLGDRKRQIASVYVWVRVTFGEPSSPPALSRPPSPPRSSNPGNATEQHPAPDEKQPPCPHYTSLKAELNTLATSLARSIDARHQ